jgi:hypothetical protein
MRKGKCINKPLKIAKNRVTHWESPCLTIGGEYQVVTSHATECPRLPQKKCTTH